MLLVVGDSVGCWLCVVSHVCGGLLCRLALAVVRCVPLVV